MVLLLECRRQRDGELRTRPLVIFSAKWIVESVAAGRILPLSPYVFENSRQESPVDSKPVRALLSCRNVARHAQTYVKDALCHQADVDVSRDTITDMCDDHRGRSESISSQGSTGNMLTVFQESDEAEFEEQAVEEILLECPLDELDADEECCNAPTLSRVNNEDLGDIGDSLQPALLQSFSWAMFEEKSIDMWPSNYPVYSANQVLASLPMMPGDSLVVFVPGVDYSGKMFGAKQANSADE
ncbi:hypothetical protein BS47DRAFT_1043191 [Hydnum rufescens UP504]|uniref:BRCT domain-containing protein n=1 Tax=Hydnum rufescens UP504 TaxID=1448309 RepID=A0A9P6AVF8_9AGAM|nr:hypothetical protein BS47DRAFT_1043191 [Hydnum rufescens UP504]